MNKTLKSAYSHYQAQRDNILSELDIMLNKDPQQGDTNRVIAFIKDLTLINMCINTLDVIMEDNKPNIDLTAENVSKLTDLIDEKLKENKPQ